MLSSRQLSVASQEAADAASLPQDDGDAGEAQPASKAPAGRKKAKKAAPTEVIAQAPPMLHLLPGTKQHTSAHIHIVWNWRHVICVVQDRREDEDIPTEDAENAAQPGRPVGMHLPMSIHLFVLQPHRL